jgi:hypothetical protein
MFVCLLFDKKRKSRAYRTPRKTPAMQVDNNRPKSYYKMTRHPIPITTVKKKQ